MMKKTLILAVLAAGPTWSLSARAHRCPMQGAAASSEPAALGRCAHHAAVSQAGLRVGVSQQGVESPIVVRGAQATPALSESSGGGPTLASPSDGMPRLPGQDAFGALQEIVGVLEADPATDWSKVNLAALREHLVDMNELTLKAKAEVKDVNGGFEARVTGEGRTLQAIQLMLPAHAPMVAAETGWSVSATLTSDGAVLSATSADPAQAQRIRALGLFGVMVKGAHHQAHHLAIARGGDPHAGLDHSRMHH